MGKIEVILKQDLGRLENDLLDRELNILGIGRVESNGDNEIYLEANSLTPADPQDKLSQSTKETLEELIGETHETNNIEILRFFGRARI
jgi:hypothetical protein